MATVVGTDASGNVWLVGDSAQGMPKTFNGVAITVYALTDAQQTAFKNLPPNRSGTSFDGSTFTALGVGPPLPVAPGMSAPNWIRDSHWHYVSTPSFTTTNGVGTPIANPANTLWWHGPGQGGATKGDFLQAIQGEWEGNPERFLRLTWTAAPTAGDAVYAPAFRFTFLEHWINTARILAGKTVTLSFQLRSPGGCPVIPIIWRSIPGQPFNAASIFSGPPVNLSGNLIQRVDFTTKLPAIPAGVNITSDSYLGVGLDIPGQFGPTIDIGPAMLNEGLPQPFPEESYWTEKLMATQPYP